MVLICTIEGLTPPVLGSPSYNLLRAEIKDVLFSSTNIPLGLTEADVIAALRLNADTDPPARVEHYNTLSRRYFSAILSRFTALRAAALRKLFTAPEIRNLEPKNDPPVSIPTTAALALELFEAFKNTGEVHPQLIYPDIYDYLYPRLRPVYPQPDKVDDAYKQQWIFDLYSDIIKYGNHITHFLHEPEKEAPISGA